jgi:transcriptional regulator
MISQEQQIAATEKQLQALKLRKQGVSYADIAKQVGYKSGSGAHAAVSKALKKTLQEPADDLRKIENERLDAMLSALWTKIEAGNPQAVIAGIKISERRAKLNGLDEPSEVDVTSAGGAIAIVLDR